MPAFAPEVGFPFSLPHPPHTWPQHPYLQAKLQCNAQQHGVWWCVGWRGGLAGILCQLEEQGWGVDVLLDRAQNCMQPLGVSWAGVTEATVGTPVKRS